MTAGTSTSSDANAASGAASSGLASTGAAAQIDEGGAEPIDIGTPTDDATEVSQSDEPADTSDSSASDYDASGSPCIVAGGDCLTFACGGGTSTLSCGQSGLFCCLLTVANCEGAGGTCVPGSPNPACVIPGPQFCPHAYTPAGATCCLSFTVVDAGPCSEAPGGGCIGDDAECTGPKLEQFTCGEGSHCCLTN
jgi:hypothetical protein